MMQLTPIANQSCIFLWMLLKPVGTFVGRTKFDRTLRCVLETTETLTSIGSIALSSTWCNLLKVRPWRTGSHEVRGSNPLRSTDSKQESPVAIPGFFFCEVQGAPRVHCMPGFWRQADPWASVPQSGGNGQNLMEFMFGVSFFARCLGDTPLLTESIPSAPNPISPQCPVQQWRAIDQ